MINKLFILFVTIGVVSSIGLNQVEAQGKCGPTQINNVQITTPEFCSTLLFRDGTALDIAEEKNIPCLSTCKQFVSDCQNQIASKRECSLFGTAIVIQPSQVISCTQGSISCPGNQMPWICNYTADVECECKCQLVDPTCKVISDTFATTGIVTFKFQDTGSGLKFIELTQNVSNSFATTPSLNVGDKITFTSKPTNQEQTVVANKGVSTSGRIEFRAVDAFDNSVECDPIFTIFIREKGKPVRKTFIDIPYEESNIMVQNGDLGIKNLIITVNGEMFKMTGLFDNEERYMDISSAMIEGDNNTIELMAWGKPGSSAEVMISD